MPDAVTTPYSELARRALLEITPDETIGAEVEAIEDEPGVTSVRFATLLPGYPGWHWTVSVAHLDGEEPSVLEAELLPGDTALIAPDWVPWADRLAEMKAQEARDGSEGDSDDEDDESDEDDDSEDDDESDDDSDDDDDDEDDESDDDDAPRGSIVHGGDVDGVDIDDLDQPAADDEADEAPVVPAAHPEADLDDDSHADDWDGEDEDPLERRRR